MHDEFQFDVFLSHSAKDKTVVRGWDARSRLHVLKSRHQSSTLNNQPNFAPLNQERRFIPLRLDDAPIKGSLTQFLYINWPPVRERELTVDKLLKFKGRRPLRWN